MKIRLSQIPSEELFVEESIPSEELDLVVEGIKVCLPVKVKGKIIRITNAVTADLEVSTKISAECSRCLKVVELDINSNLKLSYQVENQDRFVDLGPDIREELILSYPVQFLCKPDCKGLCPKCGKSLNEGGCSCGTT